MHQAQLQRDLFNHFTRMWDKPMVPMVNNEDSGGLGPSLEMLLEEED